MSDFSINSQSCFLIYFSPVKFDWLDHHHKPPTTTKSNKQIIGGMRKYQGSLPCENKSS